MGPGSPQLASAERVARDRLPARSNWPGLDLRHLAALAAVAEAGSFRSAARRLGYTQSAISQQVAALERTVGHRVLRRASGGSPLALTEVGKRLLSLSATVETAVNAAQVAVESIAGAGTESFRVGLDLPVPQVAQAIAAIQTRHEGVLIEVVSGLRTEECLRSLDSCRFDLVLVRLPIARLGVEVRQIIESPYVAVLPPQSALAHSSEPVGLEELGHHALIAVDWDPAISSLHLCSPTIVVSSVHLALAAINEGAGVGVLPGVIVAGDGQHPNVRPLRDCLSPLRVGACVRADEESPGIASAFLTELAAAVEPDLR